MRAWHDLKGLPLEGELIASRGEGEGGFTAWATTISASFESPDIRDYCRQCLAERRWCRWEGDEVQMQGRWLAGFRVRKIWT
jgi:hypothetical protein